MNLQGIQAIIFDSRCSSGLSTQMPSREEYLQRYLQPLFRESLERLSSLGYKLLWLEEDYPLSALFLKKLQLLHFFEKIYALPKKTVADGADFESILSSSGYAPSQVLYLSFEMSASYIVAKKLGFSCFLFQEGADSSLSRFCIPKFYTLVPLLLKSKQAPPLYVTYQRQSVLNSLVGLHSLKPFSYVRNTKTLSSLIDSVFQQTSPSSLNLEQAILASWEEIVGEKLSSQCRPGRIVKGKHLVVLAYNAIIKQELHFKTKQILKKLQALTGGEQLCALSIQQRS